MLIDYNNRRFRSVSNSANGEVSGETLFHYHQEGNVAWAEYRGGAIILGNLIARVYEDGSLEFSYQHLNTDGQLMTGKCVSTPEILTDGRIRLHEKWQWTSGDHSSGESIIEELSA